MNLGENKQRMLVQNANYFFHSKQTKSMQLTLSSLGVGVESTQAVFWP